MKAVGFSRDASLLPFKMLTWPLISPWGGGGEVQLSISKPHSPHPRPPILPLLCTRPAAASFLLGSLSPRIQMDPHAFSHHVVYHTHSKAWAWASGPHRETSSPLYV